MVTFSQWLESETLAELAGLLDDNGLALLERVYDAGHELGESGAGADTLALRLERVVDVAMDQDLWCKPELHTKIMQAALGKDAAE